MDYCNSTEPLEPQTEEEVTPTHRLHSVNTYLQGALGEDWKQGDKTTRKNLPCDAGMKKTTKHH